jgi:hypothetical protein
VTSEGTGGDSTSETVTEASSTTDADTTESTTTETSTATTGGGTGGVDPESLITNGDFSQGEANWEFSGDGEVDASTGEYCITFNNAGTAYADWPVDDDPATIEASTSYVLSYQAYYSGSNATVSTKIGQPYDPYAAFAEGDISIGTSLETFMHTFSASSDDQAGIRFTVNGEAGVRVCFDNVQLLAE